MDSTPKEWTDYLARLAALPSVDLRDDLEQLCHWDNLFDYYANKLAIPITVEKLGRLEYCDARAVLTEYARRLDAAIAKEKGWFSDPDELYLMQNLRRAL